MAVELDHILWAAPDLDKGAAVLESLTGVTPARGGSHTGFGTRNSLLSLGATYLEIISPDPEQVLDGNRGGFIAALPRPGLMTFAVRTGDLDAFGAAAQRAGVAVQGPVSMGRTRPDGIRLDWACLYVKHAVYGELIPFAIDWRNSSHPAASTPAGCQLVDLTVLHPDPDPLVEIYRILGVPVGVKRAAEPGLLATIATPRGDVILTSF